LEKTEHHACRKVGLRLVGLLLFCCDARENSGKKLTKLILEVSKNARIYALEAGIDFAFMSGKVGREEVLEDKSGTLVKWRNKNQPPSGGSICGSLLEFVVQPTKEGKWT
jgi:hypothetical protein